VEVIETEEEEDMVDKEEVPLPVITAAN